MIRLNGQRIYDNERQASGLGSARRIPTHSNPYHPSYAVWPRHLNGLRHTPSNGTLARALSRSYGYRTICGRHLVCLPTMPQHAHHKVLRQCGARGLSTHGSSTTARPSPCVRRVIVRIVVRWCGPSAIHPRRVWSRPPQSLRSPVSPVRQSVSIAQLLTLRDSAMPQSLHLLPPLIPIQESPLGYAQRISVTDWPVPALGRAGRECAQRKTRRVV